MYPLHNIFLTTTPVLTPAVLTTTQHCKHYQSFHHSIFCPQSTNSPPEPTFMHHLPVLKHITCPPSPKFLPLEKICLAFETDLTQRERSIKFCHTFRKHHSSGRNSKPVKPLGGRGVVLLRLALTCHPVLLLSRLLLLLHLLLLLFSPPPPLPLLALYILHLPLLFLFILYLRVSPLSFEHFL